MSRRHFQILYVDGENQHAALVSEMLQSSRRKVLHLSDGTDVLTYLQQGEGARRRPNLILLDLNLPRSDGCHLLEQLKSDEALRRIPVVVLSSSKARLDVLKAYDRFASCYVAKPADREAFRRMLQGLEEFWFRIAKLPAA